MSVYTGMANRRSGGAGAGARRLGGVLGLWSLTLLSLASFLLLLISPWAPGSNKVKEEVWQEMDEEYEIKMDQLKKLSIAEDGDDVPQQTKNSDMLKNLEGSDPEGLGDQEYEEGGKRRRKKKEKKKKRRKEDESEEEKKTRKLRQLAKDQAEYREWVRRQDGRRGRQKEGRNQEDKSQEVRSQEVRRLWQEVLGV